MVSKSEKVREYLRKHPDEPARSIADRIGCDPAIVYRERKLMSEHNNGNGNGTHEDQAAEAQAPNISREDWLAESMRLKPSITLDDLFATKEFVQKCGSIERASEALQTLQQLQS